MSDKAEMWSGPWHALQRSLAAQLAAGPAAGESPNRNASAPRVAFVSAANWLVRAHGAAARLPAPTEPGLAPRSPSSAIT